MFQRKGLFLFNNEEFNCSQSKYRTVITMKDKVDYSYLCYSFISLPKVPRSVTTFLQNNIHMWKWKWLSGAWLFVTSWTIQSMAFSRPEYWSGLPVPSQGNLPNLGMKPEPPAFRKIMSFEFPFYCIGPQPLDYIKLFSFLYVSPVWYRYQPLVLPLALQIKRKKNN